MLWCAVLLRTWVRAELVACVGEDDDPAVSPRVLPSPDSAVGVYGEAAGATRHTVKVAVQLRVAPTRQRLVVVLDRHDLIWSVPNWSKRAK